MVRSRRKRTTFAFERSAHEPPVMRLKRSSITGKILKVCRERTSLGRPGHSVDHAVDRGSPVPEALLPQLNPMSPDLNSWEVGYHYTSWTNWLTIREEGLKPVPLSEDKIAKVRPKTIDDWNGHAVWVWVERLNALEHMGSLIYQLAKRNEAKIVHLRVWYQFKDRLPPHPNLQENGNRLGLTHNGAIDGYRYHARTRSCLLVNTVPPENIELLRTYDLIELLK